MAGESPYSRDEAVSAIKSFYEFLTTLPGLLPSAIQYAPPGGWPEINSNTMAPLGKNEVIIDLLRHLPYIDSNSPGTVEIAYQTIAINFNRLAEKKPKQFTIGANLEGFYVPVDCELPEHVVSLTKGRRYGSWLLLDTKEGK